MKSQRMPGNIQQTSDKGDNKISLITNFNGSLNGPKRMMLSPSRLSKGKTIPDESHFLAIGDMNK